MNYLNGELKWKHKLLFSVKANNISKFADFFFFQKHFQGFNVMCSIINNVPKYFNNYWLSQMLLFVLQEADIWVILTDDWMFQTLGAEDQNVAFSPVTTWVLLALMSEGARGTTLQELRRSLSLPQDTRLIHQGFGNIRGDILVSQEGRPFALRPK